MEHHAPAVAGVHRQLEVLPHQEGRRQGRLVGVGPGELLPAGLGLVGGQLHPRHLAVGKDKQQLPGVVPGGTGPHHPLLRVHGQLGGQVVAQDAGLGVVEVGHAGLVALLLVGEHQQLVPVGALPAEPGAVSLLVLLVAGHPQGLGGDLFEVPLLGEEQIHRVVRGLVLLPLVLVGLVVIEDLRAAGNGVLLLHLGELVHDDLPDALGVVDGDLQVGDLRLQGVHLLGALEDILLIDVPQADIRHVLRLDLVDAEPDHQVGHHLRVLLGLPDDLDGPVDVQKDALETLQKVQLVLLLLHVEVDPPPHGLGTPGGPLLQDFPHPHHPGHAGDEDVEVAGLAVLEGGHAEQLGHQLVRVGAPL